MKKTILCYLLFALCSLLPAADFLGFTPSPDARTQGHSVFYGSDTNTAAWPLQINYVGDAAKDATNFNLSAVSSPPPQGSWISVRAWGHDGTNLIWSVYAAPVQYDTNKLTVWNPIAPLAPPTASFIYRQ